MSMNNTWIFLKAVPFEGPATFVPNGLKTKSDFMIMAKVKKNKISSYQVKSCLSYSGLSMFHTVRFI